MAYTANQACSTLDRYLHIADLGMHKQIIENTKNRGFLLTLPNDEKIVIFVYPLVHKQDDTKNYFDTRDSGPHERAIAWNYALEHRYKYFCLGVNDQVEKYQGFVFSLECNERTIEVLSGTQDGDRSTVGSGNQIIIPNRYIPLKPFERIQNNLGTFISVINENSLLDYLEKYDNRPYLLDDEMINLEDILENDGNNENGEEQETTRLTGGRNMLFYGVPGAGKSHEIDGIIDKERSERVVFHPDYTYSDFVGQILPRIIKNEGETEGKLRYVFEPGPFTKMLKKAAQNPENMYYLVIEEINRGNAPAIFGDIFQLLDRNDDGSGKYSISNYDMSTTIYGVEDHDIVMPSNLTVLATMNTSDQNVFTLDTAFQRRWEMHLIKNDVTKAKHAGDPIEGSKIKWGQFADVTNREIIHFVEETGSSEDKRLGAYFARVNELSKDKFPEKVLKYLWDDVFKMDHHAFFNENISSLDNIIDAFRDETDPDSDPLKRVLRYATYQKMLAQKTESAVGVSNVEEGEKTDDK